MKFGNVEQAFLSLPIQALWRKNLLLRSSLNQAFAFWHPTRNFVGWVVTPSGDTTSRWVLAYNYALSNSQPGGKKYWSIWKFPVFGLKSAATMLTPATWDALLGSPHGSMTPVPIFGLDQGFMIVGDSLNLDDFGNAYFVGIVTYFNPTGASATANVSITVDRRVQSTSFSLAGGGATLT